MTDMIEKIARAMCEADGFDWADQTDPMRSANGDENGQAHYLAHAKAALTALEQPSAEMSQAGGFSLGMDFDPEGAERVFSAMIKAARGDQ